MPKKAATVGDIGTDHDGFPPTPIIEGSQDIIIDNKPAARVGDALAPHANASLKFALRGYTGIHQERPAFFVERVGVYLKDTYDFVDDNKYASEPLGVRSKHRVLTKAESTIYLSSYASGLFGMLSRAWSGFVPVYNRDFRDWQDKHNTGGDFIVFSDVLWLNPLPHQRIIFL